MKIKIDEKATLELDLQDECTIEEFLGAVQMVQRLQKFSENTETTRAYTPTGKFKLTPELYKDIMSGKLGDKVLAQKYGTLPRKIANYRYRIKKRKIKNIPEQTKTIKNGIHHWTTKQKKDLLKKGTKYTAQKYHIDIKKCYVMSSALKHKGITP